MGMKRKFFTSFPSVSWPSSNLQMQVQDSVRESDGTKKGSDGESARGGRSVVVQFTMTWDGQPDVQGVETVTFDEAGKIVRVEVRRN